MALWRLGSCGARAFQQLAAVSRVAISVRPVLTTPAPIRQFFSILSKPAAPAARFPLGIRVRTNATVSAPAAAPAAEVSAPGQKAVGYWMLGCCGMVFGAVVLGGVTRLTESGLSMVTWDPISGTIPPLTQKEWEAEFERYKQFPEYKYLDYEMTLDQFKRIFYWEWGHRVWGRLVGLVYAVPAIVFWKKGYIQPQWRRPVVALGALIGFQGLLGWLMVKSGLDHDPQGRHVPRVSHYRLAAHLGSAFALYVGFLWSGLSHVFPRALTVAEERVRGLRMLAHNTAALVFITAISGAFVAGMDAGLIYNEFPLMGGRVIPQDIFQLEPKWRNFLENPTTVQFDHRVLGVTTATVVSALWYKSRSLPLHPRARLVANAMVAMVCTQVALGISTLLYYVPVSLAATHQAGSLTLLTLVTWFMHELRRIPK